MIELELPKPSPKQELFMLSRAKYTAFGGARGGGKSFAVREKAVLLCNRYKGIKVMIVRQTYPELQENHIIPLCNLLRCHAPRRKDRIAFYNDSKKHITFRNGSRILFRYCENDKDADRFQGTEVDVLFVDEATHQSEDRVKKLNACVRGVNNFPKQVFYTMNPGGIGHSWVKRLFIDREYKELENPDDYVFIQSLVTDNEILLRTNKDYVRQLEALPPKLRKAWLDGDWDIFEGQFFEDFVPNPTVAKCLELGMDADTLRARRQWCHVIDPFDMNDQTHQSWPIYRSYDFGYNKPASLGYWTVDYDGVVYRIMEVYFSNGNPNEGKKWNPDQQFAYIAQLEQTHPWFKGRQITGGVADPACWNASMGISVAETASKYGIWFTPGDNERIAGWMQFHYRLQFDHNGKARMYIFRNCKDFIRTIPLMMYDDTKVEDIDTDLEDHIADDARYFLMTRPIEPLRPVETQQIYSDPLDQFKTRR